MGNNQIDGFNAIFGSSAVFGPLQSPRVYRLCERSVETFGRPLCRAHMKRRSPRTNDIVMFTVPHRSITTCPACSAVRVERLRRYGAPNQSTAGNRSALSIIWYKYYLRVEREPTVGSAVPPKSASAKIPVRRCNWSRMPPRVRQ